jgi:hypothetical protein
MGVLLTFRCASCLAFGGSVAIFCRISECSSVHAPFQQNVANIQVDNSEGPWMQDSRRETGLGTSRDIISHTVSKHQTSVADRMSHASQNAKSWIDM